MSSPPEEDPQASLARGDEESVTRLLSDASDGDEAAFREVFALVYDELMRLARQVRRGRASETLDTTALVHEAYVHLLPSKSLDWQGRGHFFAVAARAMRQVLVRAAEKKATLKRGSGASAVELDDAVHGAPATAAGLEPERVVRLDEALRRLDAFSPRQARVVECRFFAGLSVEQTARALDVSEPTVKRDWQAARAWLLRELAS
jgi:RNA polymerase sigma factor (TIGR02999 family)